MNHYPKHPDVTTDQLWDHYATGASLRTVGARYGISHAGVGDRLLKAGYPLRKQWSQHLMIVCPFCGCSFRPRPGQERCAEGCREGRHGATCKQGHPLTPQNLTPRYGHAAPRCRLCLYQRQKEYRERKRT